MAYCSAAHKYWPNPLSRNGSEAPVRLHKLAGRKFAHDIVEERLTEPVHHRWHDCIQYNVVLAERRPDKVGHISRSNGIEAGELLIASIEINFSAFVCLEEVVLAFVLAWKRLRLSRKGQETPLAAVDWAIE